MIAGGYLMRQVVTTTEGADLLTLLSCADSLYNERGRGGAVSESVTLLAGSPGAAERYEIQWRLARALFFLGQQAESALARRQLHIAGIDAGKRAVRLESRRVEGHFWLGVNLALFAGALSGFKAIKPLLLARRALRRAASISEAYHDAGPLRVLGRIEHKAPWLLGVSSKLSQRYYNRALDLAPDNTVTLLYAAELALDSGDINQAVALLERIMNCHIDSEWDFENRRDVLVAQELLERLRGGKWENG